ncbi:hypothetical protein [Thermococcus eurythermalis]|nr:hypothetical protein [Thermococcus eurythermalis]
MDMSNHVTYSFNYPLYHGVERHFRQSIRYGSELMELKNLLLHLSVIAFSTAWELMLAYNSRSVGGYYVEKSTIFFENWTAGAGRPCVSWSKYSPSLEFVLLVLLPALVLLILYLWFKVPTLMNSAISVGLPVLSVIVVYFKTTGPGVLLVLLVVSAVVGGH